MSAPTIVLLVRHGVTPTTGQVLPGRAAGLHLSEQGLAQAAKVADRTKIGAGYESTFEGKGDTLAKNDFKSNITAIVTDVLPNGHLVVAGEKQVGVNRSVDVLRFSGIVDPRRLAPGSVIDSRYVANVRVISRGMGEQAEAQAMGWLARAFNTVTPF